MNHASASDDATDTPLVIIDDDPGVLGVTVHHRDFPEIRATGTDAAAAYNRLIHHLSRTLDSALTTWRRDTIERAIADVNQFSATQP